VSPPELLVLFDDRHDHAPYLALGSSVHREARRGILGAVVPPFLMPIALGSQIVNGRTARSGLGGWQSVG
jgi:hypothetical protein